MSDTDYIFGYQKDNKWIESSSKYAKSKLLVTRQWTKTNVPKFKDVVNGDDYEYPEAPDILELEDDEKFKDADGNVLNIEVRGERKHNDCYFKVQDVSTAFEMDRLHSSLTNDNTKYKSDTHYKYFIVKKYN